ncbi:MAG: sce7726 family protein [Deltaproteobacteria bacterium]|nr:sce7726 family protein [Deltaproteobacteria bacterium]
MKRTSGEARAVRDRDVRQALRRKVLREHIGDSNTLVLDELGLRHGACRVDIAVVNSYLHGYEIKSDADTLERLPNQISVYSAVLDRATLVVGRKHIEKVKAVIPEWWGIKVVSVGPRGGIDFENYRPLSMNPEIDPLALAELLWRPEALRILQELGAPPAILRKPRSSLYRYLAEVLKLDKLRRFIRQCLKARERWRGHSPLSLGADL